MFQVIFIDCADNETPYSINFIFREEAEKWAYSCEYDYQDIAIDEYGNDYWKTFYRFYNPEDNQSYIGIEIREIK